MMEDGHNEEERDFLTPSPEGAPEDSREERQTSQGPLSIQAEEGAEVRVEPNQENQLSSEGESEPEETELTRVR